MKRNKYRWREMKDEFPAYGEYVLLSSNDKSSSYFLRLPKTVSFVSCDGVSLYVTDINGNLLMDDARRVCWRKMCKLPGEK